MEEGQAQEPNATPDVRGSTPNTPRRSGTKWIMLLVVLVIVVVGLATSLAIDRLGDNDDQPSSVGGQDDEPKPTTMAPITDDTVICENVVPSDVSSCHDDFTHCQTDRLSHSTPVCSGQSLCNGIFRLEVTLEGHFQWKNCTSGDTIRFYDSPIQSDLNYFVINGRGVLQVRDGNNTVVWEMPSDREIEPHNPCRSGPVHDCPYIHLRKRHGAMVLNWISNGGAWVARDFKRIYPGLLDS